ncbi:hypothetical protein Tco_0778098 [Tanacetum coccineum]
MSVSIVTILGILLGSAKDALQKIVDSWFASSKNLWKLIDCGMSSTVKICLGYGIQSNDEVLGYEEEMSRGIFVLRETDEGYYDIPLYSRFKQVEYKGVPPPLSGDYTPRAQEDIDDSLYVYGKHGPIGPSNDSDGELGAVSNDSSTHYSTCQSNDSDGELGTISDHSVNDDLIHNQAPIPSIEQVTNTTQKTQPQMPKLTQTVDPSCAQHVKSPRQPIKTPVTPSPISSYNRQNWNQRMERELGAGYSFVRKPCFVCGSLSHLIKDCDYYEKKMAREAALKSKRVVHADVRQATPTWTNTNRVNKANQFTPRPNLSTTSRTINTGRENVNTARVNVNTARVNVNTGYGHVSSVTSVGIHIKSGSSRFNTGKQHVNSGNMYVKSRTQIKSGTNQTSQVNFTSPKKCFSKQSSPVNGPFSRNTAYKSHKYVVKGKVGTAVKTSAGCVWRTAIPLSNTNCGPTPDSNVNVFRGPQGRPKPVKAWWLIWRLSELSKVGSVILEEVKVVSVEKICDKKLNVLFTKKECFVVSSDFKMPDANQDTLVFCKKPHLMKLNCGHRRRGMQHQWPHVRPRLTGLWTSPLTLHMGLIWTYSSVRNIQTIARFCLVITDDCSSRMGLAGRMNRKDLIEAARTMLADSHLPTTFWAEAVNTACYTFNRKVDVFWGKIATRRPLLKQPSSTPISKSADDIMTFRKELDALALKHLGPVPATAPTSTNPVNTGSINLNTAFEEVNTGNLKLSLLVMDHEEEASFVDDGIISNFNNLPDEVDVPTNHTLRIHNAHPQRSLRSLADGSWVDAMEEELLQFKLLQRIEASELFFSLVVYVFNLWVLLIPDHPTKVTPKTSHLNAVKRIFKYLKGKPNLGLWYPRESPLNLEPFSDSDYGGSNLDRKSITGGCQFLGQRLISWQGKETDLL